MPSSGVVISRQLKTVKTMMKRFHRELEDVKATEDCESPTLSHHTVGKRVVNMSTDQTDRQY